MRKLILLALLAPLCVFAQSNPIGINTSLPLASGPPNDPPVWSDAPDTSFTLGSLAASDLSVFVNDPEGDTLTFLETSCTYPTGVTLDSPNSEIDYDGTGSTGVTSNCVLSADDGTNDPVNSPAYTISIDTVIVVQDDGNDTTGDGSGGNPYATIEKALSVATGGDTIELRKSGTGTWTYANYVTIDENFTSGNEVTIRVRSGDRVNIYPTTTSSSAVLLLNGASYIIVDGSVGDLYIGDRSLWTGTGGGNDTYPYNAVFRSTNNSHHFDIRYVHFSGAAGSQAIEPEDDSHHYRFKGITGYGHGTVPDVGPGGANYEGDGIRLVGENWIVEDSTLSAPFGGHNSAMIFGNNGVVRNNTFYMNWGDYTDQSANSGYRAFSLSRQNIATNYSSSAPWGPTLMEGNIIRRPGHVTDSRTTHNANYKLSGFRTIFRYNYIFDALGDQTDGQDELLPQPHATHDNTGHIQQYNNTFDNNVNIHYRPAGQFNTSNGTNQNHYEQRIFNNIYSNITEAAVQPPALSSPHVIWVRNAQRWDIQSYSDSWQGSEWFGNMFDSDAFHIKVSDSVRGTVDTDTLAEAKTQWPSVFAASNNANAPTYVNSAAKTKAGFALDTGSNGIDEAQPAATVQSGSTGANVTLDETYWIYDGFDLSYFGEAGDYIAFYDSTGTTLRGIRQVSSVDSQTGVTLTSAITLTAGDIVFPVLSDGTTVVDNIGANQSDP